MYKKLYNIDDSRMQFTKNNCFHDNKEKTIWYEIALYSWYSWGNKILKSQNYFTAVIGWDSETHKLGALIGGKNENTSVLPS